MAEYKLELTIEASKSCTENPSARLSLILLEMKSGDKLEVVGEDLYFRYDMLKEILIAQGLEIVEDEYDGLTYRIVAVKP
ncbi:MAG: hypothetical protein F7C35_06070 [Desulfurococcales archaeon]|nr:hypothetical protein [Desulfurococcales archaeon]